MKWGVMHNFLLLSISCSAVLLTSASGTDSITPLSDIGSYLLLELSSMSATNNSVAYELVSTDELRFCQFPSSSYVYNDYQQLPKQGVPAPAAQSLISQAQKLAIFCITHSQSDQATVCGIELAGFRRMQCAYVFRNLPGIEHLQAYLVPQAVVVAYEQTVKRQPEAEIVTDQLDQAGEDLELDWSALAHDLNSEPLAPVPEQRYRVTLWFLKVKNFVLQKAVALLMYVLEKK